MVLEQIIHLVKMKGEKTYIEREEKRTEKQKNLIPSLQIRNKSAKKRTRFQLRTPANEANGGHKREDERKREKERKGKRSQRKSRVYNLDQRQRAVGSAISLRQIKMIKIE